MGWIERITSRGQLVPLLFTQDQLAASQTDAAVNVIEAFGGTTLSVLDANAYTMPWDGEVVGVSFRLSAAASAGQMTLGATINGTEDADTTVTITTQLGGYKRVPRGAARFVAGDRIGAEITTSAAWNGTSADLLAIVWVLVQLEGV